MDEQCEVIGRRAVMDWGMGERRRAWVGDGMRGAEEVSGGGRVEVRGEWCRVDGTGAR